MRCGDPSLPTCLLTHLLIMAGDIRYVEAHSVVLDKLSLNFLVGGAASGSTAPHGMAEAPSPGSPSRESRGSLQTGGPRSKAGMRVSFGFRDGPSKTHAEDSPAVDPHRSDPHESEPSEPSEMAANGSSPPWLSSPAGPSTEHAKAPSVSTPQDGQEQHWLQSAVLAVLGLRAGKTFWGLEDADLGVRTGRYVEEWYAESPTRDVHAGTTWWSTKFYVVPQVSPRTHA